MLLTPSPNAHNHEEAHDVDRSVKFTVKGAAPDNGVPLKSTAGGSEATLLDVADEGPVPTALVATTVKLYVVPLVSPITVIGLDAPVPIIPPGLEVTVYDVIALLPPDAGAVKLTEAPHGTAVAVPIVGSTWLGPAT